MRTTSSPPHSLSKASLPLGRPSGSDSAGASEARKRTTLHRVMLGTPWDKPAVVDAAANDLLRITYAIAAAVLVIGLIAWVLPALSLL